MFSYLSGFLSDLDFDQHADVYVYLLLPKKFMVRRDCRELFGHHEASYSSSYSHIESGSDVMMSNGTVGIWKEFVPFALPFKARYIRDCGIYLDEETPTTKWLESNFNINLKEYLENLSNQRYGDTTQEITFDNIFNYLGVALEHVSFVKKVVHEVAKDPDYNHGQEQLTTRWWDYYKHTSLTNEFITAKSLVLEGHKRSHFDLIACTGEIKYEAQQNKVDMIKDLVHLSALHFFMLRTNRIFKPCDVGGQRWGREYIDIMNDAKTATMDEIFVQDEDEEE